VQNDEALGVNGKLRNEITCVDAMSYTGFPRPLLLPCTCHPPPKINDGVAQDVFLCTVASHGVHSPVGAHGDVQEKSKPTMGSSSRVLGRRILRKGSCYTVGEDVVVLMY
jgi:hypothetical protein